MEFDKEYVYKEEIMSEGLLEYVTEDGKKLYAPADNKPIGDGYYINPGQYNRSRSCGTCTLVGMCQYCPMNPLLSAKRRV